MTVATAGDPLARGNSALAPGDREAARDAFAEAITATDSPDALDGLGRSLCSGARSGGCGTVVERNMAAA